MKPLIRNKPGPVVATITEDESCKGLYGTSQLIIVLSIPAPNSVRFLDMFKVLVQVKVPAGTMTVSPAAADCTAAPTSAKEALLAVRAAARSGAKSLRDKVIKRIRATP